MCTTSEATLPAKAALALRSIADDVSDVARGWLRSVGPGAGRGPEALERGSSVDPRIAATALMLEVANADDRFSAPERRLVACTLQTEFGLGTVQADRLVRAAERARGEAPGVWTFTSVLVESLTLAQRRILAGILERLADADGSVTWQEHYAIRKITSLMRVEPAHV